MRRLKGSAGGLGTTDSGHNPVGSLPGSVLIPTFRNETTMYIGSGILVTVLIVLAIIFFAKRV